MVERDGRGVVWDRGLASDVPSGWVVDWRARTPKEGRRAEVPSELRLVVGSRVTDGTRPVLGVLVALEDESDALARSRVELRCTVEREGRVVLVDGVLARDDVLERLNEGLRNSRCLNSLCRCRVLELDWLGRADCTARLLRLGKILRVVPELTIERDDVPLRGMLKMEERELPDELNDRGELVVGSR